MMVESGSGKTGVGGLEGTVAVISGSGAGETIVGRLTGTVAVVGRSSGAKVVVVVVVIVTGSTVVEVSTGALV